MRSLEHKLVFRTFPWAAWFMGIIFGCSFIFTLFFFIFGKNQEENYFVKEIEITWWMILLSIFLFVLSILFLASSRIKVVTINKNLGSIELCKINLACKESKKTGYMTETYNLQCLRKGTTSRYNYTVHYEVTATFRTQQPIILYVTRSRTKAI